MKTILLVSDTHYEREVLMKIIEKNPTCDAYIHCGDSQLKKTDPVLNKFIVVAGNTDVRQPFNDDEVIEFIPYTFFVTHGHRYQVNWHMSELVQAAKTYGAQIACFGHTHVPYCEVHNDILCLNPGSAVSPRGEWRFGTYTLVKFADDLPNQLQVEFYDSKSHQRVSQQVIMHQF